MSFEKNGYEFIEDFIPAKILNNLQTALEKIPLEKLSGGIRNAEKKFPEINQLVNSPLFIHQATRYLKAPATLVRVILFDKTPENNWLVSWHQDKTVCVSHKFTHSDWHAWSVKDGIHHVQPPLAVLNQMVTFRLHIDDSTLDNGCLKIIPGSHANGILPQEKINGCDTNAVNCIASAGTMLAMKPHLLHASGKATKPSRRRVIHIEYTSHTLPEHTHWAY